MAETLSFDVQKIRKDFPILSKKINGYPLVYLDNAASSQKPQQVIEAMNNYYMEDHSNVHRGVHYLSSMATEAFESARKKIRDFIHAGHAHEIIFTRGTTEGLNLIASSFGKSFIRENDEVIISALEHHSNIVPWQLLCEQKGAKIKVIPVDECGELVYEEFLRHISPRTKIISVGHVSNALGTVNPVKQIIAEAHRRNITVMLDGAQAAPHLPIDVKALDCDFYTFSSHKMLGPTGIGVLYGKEKWLEKMPPYQGGGEMIERVTFEKTTYNELPYKFEAGTPAIAEAIGLGAAIDYLNSMGIENIGRYEDMLLNYAVEKLSEVAQLRLIGTPKERKGVISFLIGDIHPYDTGTILDKFGIAVRTGHHCCMPLMERFGIPGTVRASFSFYNTVEEVEQLINCVEKSVEMLSTKKHTSKFKQ